jgi:XRE family transcriptional regulator, aerobic/anaerobic benzoate catabolism transcriptional regulator
VQAVYFYLHLQVGRVSSILHAMTQEEQQLAPAVGSGITASKEELTDHLLHQVGKTVRDFRKLRSLTQLELAKCSGVSVRYLGQLEAGEGNISLAKLAALARALKVELFELVGGPTKQPGSVLDMVDQLLRSTNEDEVRRWLRVVQSMVEGQEQVRIALLGVRGAGKSTIGKRLAERLQVPFTELDQLVEDEAGVPLRTIFELHGEAYYRRLERSALQQLITSSPRFVVATGGSIVTSPSEYALLKRTCTTIWLSASPEDHWERVVAQGDVRPMQANPHAMDELRALLSAREPLYKQAHLVVNTSDDSIETSVESIVSMLSTQAMSRSQNN